MCVHVHPQPTNPPRARFAQTQQELRTPLSVGLVLGAWCLVGVGCGCGCCQLPALSTSVLCVVAACYIYIYYIICSLEPEPEPEAYSPALFARTRCSASRLPVPQGCVGLAPRPQAHPAAKMRSRLFYVKSFCVVYQNEVRSLRYLRVRRYSASSLPEPGGPGPGLCPGLRRSPYQVPKGAPRTKRPAALLLCP
jgi:hypothetical protein